MLRQEFSPNYLSRDQGKKFEKDQSETLNSGTLISSTGRIVCPV